MTTPMPRPCSVAAALGVIGEKWSLLVIRELAFGVHRFDAIARNTGAPRGSAEPPDSDVPVCVLDQAQPQRIDFSRLAAARSGVTRPTAAARSQSRSLPYSITGYRRRQMELPDARVLHLEPDLDPAGEEAVRRLRSPAAPGGHSLGPALRSDPCRSEPGSAGTAISLQRLVSLYRIRARLRCGRSRPPREGVVR